MTLFERVSPIEQLFESMHGQNASDVQRAKVARFKADYPYLVEDLDFCFEVLAGRHKLGFTVVDTTYARIQYFLSESSIRELVMWMKATTSTDKTEVTIDLVCMSIPREVRSFMIKLLNREYRLGFSNKAAMVTDMHCMLAKTYPDGIKFSKMYYVQEKLNGNRCISYFDNDSNKWCFISRSQKPMNLNFDMTGFNPDRIYDGEVMTRGKTGNRDFAKTSGAINSKYGDKSELMYFIYDIIDENMSYKERRQELIALRGHISPNIVILRVLDKILVSPNPEENAKLDYWLDFIVDKGGEGVMLRDPDAPYYRSKNSGDRKPYLLKYKKTKTCDLRIIGFNEGEGKYEGLIGSFICETDEHTVLVSVAGIDDTTRWSAPADWIGKIVEVAYFETSQSQTKGVLSLQFPRFKRVRDDKTETSMY